jgi:hypothetical protein
VDDKTLEAWVSKSSWVKEKVKILGEDVLKGVLEDWLWADTGIAEGRRWVKEIYLIFKDTH